MSTATTLRLDHLDIARRFANAPEGWVVPPRFDPIERWYSRLHVADDYEVWLLTWLPGQQTELHDHGGSAGAFHVFSGTLTEDTVSGPASAPRVTSRDLGDGAGRRFGTHHVHRIVNRGADPAISIHVYGPALTSMTKYRLGPAGLETLVVERAGAQW
ncbi:hypothetical protein BJY16_002049 [Actinoplanes octamycinicus]|uniref:Cysteine dioxygenase type I n=1 Tax=Actinoplanes octamycinicus TaxID=135948 RepID=A0A7W7GUK7_9ACTN|nr:cysteine dioxygenase family protein [Actinoplanes octamycinicus]MBB4738590.1 hypothetical protein [Actinoplanes octamycinicus]